MTTKNTIRSQANGKKLLLNIQKFSNHTDWINELIQNAYRSGASKISIEIDGNDFIIEDNGHGLIDLNDWEQLIYLSESNWKNEEVSNQDPAGMGIFSAISRFEATLHSRNTIYVTTPEAIQKSLPIENTEVTEYIPGFKIRLKDAASTYEKRCTQFPHPLQGYRYQMGKKSLELNWNLMKDGKTIKSPFQDIENWKRKEQTIDAKTHDQTSSNHYNSNKKIQISNFYEDCGDFAIWFIPEFQKQGERNTKLHFCHHGQIISEEPEQNEPALGILNYEIVIDIYGKSPVNFVHPHRERIQKDEKYDTFIKTQILPKIQKLLKEIKTEIGITSLIYPKSFGCGEFNNIKLHTLGIFSNDSSGYKQEFYQEKEEVSPKNKELKYFVEEPIQLKYANILFSDSSFDRNNEECKIEGIPCDPKHKTYTASNQIYNTLQNEACDGNLNFTYIDDDTLSFSLGYNAKIPLHQYREDPRYIEDPKITVDYKETITRGSMEFKVCENITFHTKSENGKTMPLKGPICIILNECYYSLLVNPEFIQELNSNPEKIFQLWDSAVEYAYKDNDNETFNEYVEAVKTDKSKHLFVGPEVNNTIKDFINILIKKSFPELWHNIRFGETKTHIKKFNIKSGKIQTAEITIEEVREGITHKIHWENEKFVKNTTQRKKR
jgi:hypothetical protein